MVTERWHDREFERKVLDPGVIRFLNRIGARGEAIAKELISGPLRAIDKGILRASLTFEVIAEKFTARIGVPKHSEEGVPLKYAIYVFMGTVKMKARPVLRTMLAHLQIEIRRWT